MSVSIMTIFRLGQISQSFAIVPVQNDTHTHAFHCDTVCNGVYIFQIYCVIKHSYCCVCENEKL